MMHSILVGAILGMVAFLLVSSEALPITDSLFIRGDFNADGIVNAFDAVCILRHAFIPGAPGPWCEDAADADDNGKFSNVLDAIYVLRYVFVPGAPSPLPPYPDCGQDPTDDELSCESFPLCGTGDVTGRTKMGWVR